MVGRSFQKSIGCWLSCILHISGASVPKGLNDGRALPPDQLWPFKHALEANQTSQQTPSRALRLSPIRKRRGPKGAGAALAAGGALTLTPTRRLRSTAVGPVGGLSHRTASELRGLTTSAQSLKTKITSAPSGMNPTSSNATRCPAQVGARIPAWEPKRPSTFYRPLWTTRWLVHRAILMYRSVSVFPRCQSADRRTQPSCLFFPGDRVAPEGLRPVCLNRSCQL